MPILKYSWMTDAQCSVAGSETSPVLQQVRHVELRHPAVGDLLLRPRALPPHPPRRRRQARRERLPDGGARGMSRSSLHHHEGCESSSYFHLQLQKQTFFAGVESFPREEAEFRECSGQSREVQDPEPAVIAVRW